MKKQVNKNKKLEKKKKISEKERLQTLLAQLTMNIRLNEERVSRCQKLAERNSTKNDVKKQQKNAERLEEARVALEESLVFLGQVNDALNRIGENK